MLGYGGVLVIGGVAHVGSDTLAFIKDFNSSRRKAHLQLLVRKAIRHAVIVIVNLDVIIDTRAPNAPFAVSVGLDGQSLKKGPVKILEHLAARLANAAHRAHLVDKNEHLLDGLIELLQAVKRP